VPSKMLCRLLLRGLFSYRLFDVKKEPPVSSDQGIPQSVSTRWQGSNSGWPITLFLQFIEATKYKNEVSVISNMIVFAAIWTSS
jgi:hypothetical protein